LGLAPFGIGAFWDRRSSGLALFPIIVSALTLGLVLGGCAGRHGAAGSKVSRTYEQSYVPASHNWAFRRHYPRADRLFNAFDYGHAILSEILYTRPDAPNAVLDRDQLRFITQQLLVHPPSVPLEESAIAPTFSQLAPEIEHMFAWAHMLHRQVYDVWADDRIPDREKDARIAELVAYYQSRHDLALSARPKSMAPMESREYSGEFRRRYPKFNGLIWSYHWLQLVLYDALMSESTAAGRRAAVDRAVNRFHGMVSCPSARFPTEMPMAPAVAPRFAERYPDAAAIFDNLHALHDVVSDILASPKVPAPRKRQQLLSAAAEYRNSALDVTTVEAWREMARDMGVDDMGGLGTAPEIAGTPMSCSQP